MRVLIFSVALSSLIPCFAEENDNNQFIECEGSPDNAVLLINEPQVKRWAQVVCSKYGHAIIPTDGYIWSYYGGLAPIALMAQKMEVEKEPEEVDNSAYFTNISVKKLNSEDAKSVSEKISFGDPYPRESKPEVYFLESISNANVRQIMYFLLYEDRLSGALPYPEWMENHENRELIPFFIYDSRKSK